MMLRLRTMLFDRGTAERSARTHAPIALRRTDALWMLLHMMPIVHNGLLM